MPAFPGLTELIADLQRMPTALEINASMEVQAAAEAMAAAVRAEIHDVTGNLARGIKVTKVNAFRAVVRSTARHAHMYERGTVARMTSKGWKRGTMPKANQFIPAAIKARAEMVGNLMAAVERLTVRGMTGRLDVQERGRD